MLGSRPLIITVSLASIPGGDVFLLQPAGSDVYSGSMKFSLVYSILYPYWPEGVPEGEAQGNS